MLEIDKRSTTSGMQTEQTGKPFIELIESAFSIVRRQLPMVIVVFVCCLALGALYYFTTPPSYTATGTMLLDTRKVQLLEKESVLGDIQVDASTVQTQVEVLKSENISLAVLRKLKLTEDPEFVGDSTGLLSRVTAFLGSLTGAREAAPPSESEREKIVLEAFGKQLSVMRLGLTYVMEVSFTSLSPEKSARIVNAVVEAYLTEQMDAKYQAARRAGVWLLERIKELRAQSTAADRAVVEFKEKNNIIDTGGGKLMTEQQVSEINSQLIIARAGAAEAKARLDRIRSLMNSPNVADGAVSDTLKNEVIIKVRNQYLDLAQREAILSQKYGSNHLATINLRTQMQELKRNIVDEMSKIAESYKSDYEIAKAREESLKTSLDAVVTEAQIGGQAAVQLRELEANRETAKAIYDSFLQRYMEASQQQDAMPISETRLISPAAPPLKKSAPKGSLVLLVSLALGGILSFGVAFLREASDSVLRTTDQVESNLHSPCLAMVPVLKASSTSRSDKAGAFDENGFPVESSPPARDLLRQVIDSPFSRYAEAIRSIKIAADVNGALKAHRIIGITSTLPNEGKSTIASNLAHLIADAGANAVLVDADLRSPSLSNKLAPGTPGVVDVVLGATSLEATLLKLPGSSGLTFLSAGSTAKLVHTNEILASAMMKNLIEILRAKFDYVVVDLSPIAPIVDVRATGQIIDTYVFVVEWGQTKLEVIERALTDAHNVYDQLLGVVLNKVDMSVQSRYERYHGDRYYRKYYSKYGYVD
jgi:succinoglycan biosynthesis transport protein ExoP